MGSAQWPGFDAPLLRGVASAFLRRRKAIAYKAGLSCERELSQSAEGALERLNLDLRGGLLRLSVWADGVLWLSVCVPAPGRGRSFKDSFYGDAQDVSPQTLVGMIESTLALPFGMDPLAEREHLREVWGRVRPRTE